MLLLQSHVIQANMLASRTKAALLSLEVTEASDDGGAEYEGSVSITAHLWRAEMMLGVVEVDKEGLVAKAGCCALHQPGGARNSCCCSGGCCINAQPTPVAKFPSCCCCCSSKPAA
jgi:hypothetical protein